MEVHLWDTVLEVGLLDQKISTYVHLAVDKFSSKKTALICIPTYIVWK